jgi:phage FluMu protein Com
MKETSFIAPVFKCSRCNYISLQKINVSNHISKKCPAAKIVCENKVIKHRDMDYECDDIATIHQCSKCAYTSQNATHAKTHIKKCPNAELLSSKRKLLIEDVPSKPKPVEIPIKETFAGGRKAKKNVSNEPVYGYFYCVIVIDAPFIKFGITTAPRHVLESRYNTYYGNCWILAVDCKDHREKETRMKKELERLDLFYCGRQGELAVHTDAVIELYESIAIDNEMTDKIKPEPKSSPVEYYKPQGRPNNMIE